MISIRPPFLPEEVVGCFKETSSSFTWTFLFICVWSTFHLCWSTLLFIFFDQLCFSSLLINFSSVLINFAFHLCWSTFHLCVTTFYLYLCTCDQLFICVWSLIKFSSDCDELCFSSESVCDELSLVNLPPISPSSSNENCPANKTDAYSCSWNSWKGWFLYFLVVPPRLADSSLRQQPSEGCWAKVRNWKS